MGNQTMSSDGWQQAPSEEDEALAMKLQAEFDQEGDYGKSLEEQEIENVAAAFEASTIALTEKHDAKVAKEVQRQLGAENASNRSKEFHATAMDHVMAQKLQAQEDNAGKKHMRNLVTGEVRLA